MSRTAPSVIQVRPIDPTSNTVEELILLDPVTPPSRVSSLIHTTQLPGGWWTLELSMAMDESEWRRWRNDRIAHRLILQQGLKTQWQGRVDSIRGDVERPTITAKGYWSNFTDAVDNAQAYSKSYDTTGDSII